VLIAVTATGPLALNIMVPSLPGLQRAFDTDYGSVQLVLTVYLIGIAVGQLLYGPLSDRHGRRPLMLAGLAIYLAGSAICLLAPSIGVLVAGRAVQAIGGCAGAVLSRAIIADVYEPERAASMLAYVIMAMVAVPMIAPAIGGALDLWLGWWAGFAVVLAAGAAVLVATFATLHETHLERRRGAGFASTISDALHLLRTPAFCGHTFQVAFTTAVFFGFLAGAPYVMVELLGRTPADYGLYFVIVSGMFMLGNFLSGRISASVGSDRMVRTGTTISLVGAAILGVVTAAGQVGALSLFGLMGVIGLGNGLSVSNGLAAAVTADPARIGTASGLAGFLQMGLGAAISYLVGSMMTDSAMPLVAVMLACAALASVSHRLGDRLAQRASRQSPARR
jgi:DHA1 family bicyclomycin/chloramphenicol resistance-like MFS transporter